MNRCALLPGPRLFSGAIRVVAALGQTLTAEDAKNACSHCFTSLPFFLPRGFVVDRYQIVANLGEGTFAKVIKAVNRQSGEVVAIKKMKQVSQIGSPAVVAVVAPNHTLLRCASICSHTSHGSSV